VSLHDGHPPLLMQSGSMHVSDAAVLALSGADASLRQAVIVVMGMYRPLWQLMQRNHHCLTFCSVVCLCFVPLMCVCHCCRFPQFSPASLAKLIPSGSPEAIDLIAKLIAWNPDSRLSSEQALRHPYFAVRNAC
jgi:serine/threonine protein kinase